MMNIVINTKKLIQVGLKLFKNTQIISKKLIQLGLMLLKIYKYQINGFANNCLERSIDRILEETNKF